MYSEELLRVCALFGLWPRDGEADEQRGARAARAAAQLLRLGRGELALVTGPSGGGKTLILRALQRAAAHGEAHGVRALAVDGARAGSEGEGHARVIDLVDGPLSARLAALARAGLSEAHVLAGTAGMLSDGQRFRLSLARALRGAEAWMRSSPAQRALIVVDEFASTLDRRTARNVARTLSRCVRATGASAVVATAHDDVLEALSPDVLVWQPLDGEALLMREGGR
jgi:ABC-type ATPase with predicted acetyltransferase domain